MHRCFAELEQAERDHASPAIIERLHDAFLQATEVYKTACVRLAAAIPSPPPPPVVSSITQHSLFGNA